MQKVFQTNSFNSNKNYRNISKESVEQTMSKMDTLNKTSFKKWIKDEQNVNYLCVTKKELILGYIEKDLESAMCALEWMVEGWSIESVAELVLKLFYSNGLKSTTFCGRVYRLVYTWDTVKIQELLSILLVGESCSVVAHFFSNWIFTSRWNSEEVASLVVPLAETYKWSIEQLGVFLIALTAHLVIDPILKQSLVVIIHDELESALKDEKKLLHYFELLLQIVIEESHVLDSNV